MKPIIITSLLVAVILVSSCTKKCWIYYNLEIPFTITTKADTIGIGDTVTIYTKFDKDVFDLNSKQYITIENFDFDHGLGISNLEDSNQNLIWNSFDLLEDIGTIHGGIKLVYNDDYYEFKHHFLPKKKGVYSIGIGFSSFSSGERRYEVDFQEGKCKEELAEQTIKINEQSDGTFDTNWEILKDNIMPNEPIGNLNRTTYSFVVE